MQAVSLAPGPEMAHDLARYLEQFTARLPASLTSERRTEVRVAIPLLLTVAAANPRDDDHEALFTAVGKDLSRGGIGFFHREAIPHRRVVLTFEDPRLEQLAVEVELGRCRFSNLGWYESGGRLVKVVQPNHTRCLAG